MKILVFKPDEYFSKEMCHFSSSCEDTIHFAVTRKEMIRLAKDLRPEIAILGKLAAMDTEFCTALRKEIPYIKILTRDLALLESFQSEFQTKK